MHLKRILYIPIIVMFACIEPTLIADKDCAGVIGGNAIMTEPNLPSGTDRVHVALNTLDQYKEDLRNGGFLMIKCLESN